jgi:hypothetical protein
MAATLLGAFFVFGSSGRGGTGQAVINAQGSQSMPGVSGRLSLTPGSGAALTSSPAQPSAAQVRAAEAHLQQRAAAMQARANGLPASDPNVQPGPPPAASSQTTPRGLLPAAAPQQADGTAVFFRNSQIVPPVGFGASVEEPAVAQSGKNVLETWNWFDAHSGDGGSTWAYINPYALDGMSDFCCDQDAIYDKGRDRFFLNRLGIGLFGCGAGCSENRDLVDVSPNGAAFSCFADLRPTLFGITNGFLDYPRLSLSDQYLYMQWNIFNSVTNAYVTHLLVRAELSALANCQSFNFTYWLFSDGWSPTLVENAREIMYLGDQIVTNTGLNNDFRVYWLFDDQTTLNFVDRTIANYQFTSGNAVCTVPGGQNPCARADQRVVGAVLEHNTPLPGNLGAAGDKIDFYWNVAQGNGFSLPYTESAGFFGNTIAYVQRKIIFNPSIAFFYTAAGANNRQHVGISLYGFWAASTGQNPCSYVGLDDDFNGNPPGWEIYATFCSTGNWTASNSGDYLRARQHSPVGEGWIATGSMYNAAANSYFPSYTVFGRQRDIPGFTRYDQQ